MGCHPLGIACVVVVLATSVQAQQTQTYFYDVHGRLTATTRAPANGGYRTLYGLDATDNRSARNAEPASARTAGDMLQAGQDLLPNQRLVSGDGRFVFILQAGDSNAVVYGPSGALLWSSGTSNGQGTVLRMQTDGNLVLIGAADEPVWNSGTFDHPGARLVMQNDGNLVIYAGATALWQSNTGGH